MSNNIEIMGVEIPIVQKKAIFVVDAEKINLSAFDKDNPNRKWKTQLKGTKDIGIQVGRKTMQKIGRNFDNMKTDGKPLQYQKDNEDSDRLNFVINLMHSGLKGKLVHTFTFDGDDYYFGDGKPLRHDNMYKVMSMSESQSFKNWVRLHKWIMKEKGEDTGTVATKKSEGELASPEMKDWKKSLETEGSLLYDWEKELRNEVREVSFRSRVIANLWLISVAQNPEGMSPEALAFRTPALTNLDPKEKRRLADKIAKKAYETYVKYPHMIHPKKTITDDRRYITKENRNKYGFPSSYTGEPEEILPKGSGNIWNKKYLPDSTEKKKTKNPTFNKQVPYMSKQTNTTSGNIINQSWYDYAKAYRSFLDSQGNNFPKFKREPATSWFAQSTKKQAGNYAHVKAGQVQLFVLSNCIEKASQSFSTYDYFTKKLEPEDKFGKYGLFLLYKICLNLGLRAEEIYTVPASKPVAKGSANPLADAGVDRMLDKYNNPTELHEITIRTRKTSWVDKYIAKGFILDKDTNKLIQQKMDFVAQGVKKYEKGEITKKQAYDDFGLLMEDVNGNPIKYHTLVGKDGEFTKPIGYGDGKWYLFPNRATYKFKSLSDRNPKSDQLPSVSVVRVAKNRELLNNALKKCYAEVGEAKNVKFTNPDYDEKKPEEMQRLGFQPTKIYKDVEPLSDPYFKKKPVHALRHLFAHIFLDLLDWNYGEVAKIGHWGTLAELERSYGEYPQWRMVENLAKASKQKKSSFVVLSKEESQKVSDGYYGDTDK